MWISCHILLESFELKRGWYTIGCNGGSPFPSFFVRKVVPFSQRRQQEILEELLWAFPPKRWSMKRRQEFQRQKEVQMEKAFPFFFLRGMFGEGEDSPSFLFMKPTIWREIYSLRILQKVRNIYQRDSRFITLGLTPWFVDVHHAKTFQRSATNGKVMFQEEQAEKARLQQQRQKMKEDPELKPRCRRLVFGYCLYHWMVFSPLLGHTCGVQKVTFQTSRGEATAAAWESSTGGETVSIRGQRLDGSPNIAKWMNQNLEIW